MARRSKPERLWGLTLIRTTLAPLQAPFPASCSAVMQHLNCFPRTETDCVLLYGGTLLPPRKV